MGKKGAGRRGCYKIAASMRQEVRFCQRRTGNRRKGKRKTINFFYDNLDVEMKL
jgi:hypothetical protein